MKILIVAAMTSDRVIGTDSGLPWDIPEEYKHYLSLVKGHPVIMGRRSFEIFGADLNDSKVIVVSHQYRSEFPAHAASLRQAIQIAKSNDKDIFIAGGASIYGDSLALADQMHLSEVKGHYEGNVHFPEISDSAWKVIHTEEYENFIYRIYERNE